MNAFEKVVQFITEKMAWISMIAIVGCMALVVTDVIRYTFTHKPIPGAHELVELIASVILSTSIAYVTFVKGHVSVGILVDNFRPRTQAVFDFINSIIALVFMVWLTEGVFEMAMRNLGYGWVTGVLQIPRAPFMFLIGAALGLACLVLVRDAIRAVIVLRKGGGHGA
jgi:TRAP-type C4-dicarboxylate transport system permease small subunit